MDPKWLWRKVKGKNAAYFTLSKEYAQELRRQTWTTYRNLNDWFEGFKVFCLDKGFAIQDLFL